MRYVHRKKNSKTRFLQGRVISFDKVTLINRKESIKSELEEDKDNYELFSSSKLDLEDIVYQDSRNHLLSTVRVSTAGIVRLYYDSELLESDIIMFRYEKNNNYSHVTASIKKVSGYGDNVIEVATRDSYSTSTNTKVSPKVYFVDIYRKKEEV